MMASRKQCCLAVVVVTALAAVACGTRVERTEEAVPGVPGGLTAREGNAGAPPSGLSTPQVSDTSNNLSGHTEVRTPGIPPADGPRYARPAADRGPTPGATLAPADATPNSASGQRRAAAPREVASDAEPGRPGPDVRPPEPGAGPRSTILLGNVGTYSGPAGSSLAELATGVQVWSRWVNDRGGVNGHPVKILVADDGGDPSRHRYLVQQMVETHRVIAFLLNGELLTGAGSVEYLSGKGIPVLGSEGASDWFYDSPTYFTHVPTGQTFWKAVASSVAEVARAKGRIRWASISCTEATTCSDAHRIWVDEAEMKAQGVEPVYHARSSLAQPDFTAECLNARNAGAQVVSIVMDASSSTRIAASCARQGYRPIYAEVGTALKPEHAQDPNKSGGLIGSMGHFLWTDSSTPATAEFQAAFRRYLGRAPGAGHAVAFAAGRMFEKAARDIGEPPTSQAVLDGMWTFRGETLDGLVMPLTFTKGQKTARQVCWATAYATGGRWDAFDARIKCR